MEDIWPHLVSRLTGNRNFLPNVFLTALPRLTGFISNHHQLEMAPWLT